MRDVCARAENVYDGTGPGPAGILRRRPAELAAAAARSLNFKRTSLRNRHNRLTLGFAQTHDHRAHGIVDR